MLSGKEAKLAWANGEKLRYITPNGWKDVDENTPLWAFDSYNFEVLVSTITINGIEIEIPKDIVIDAVTGSVGLVYGDVSKSKQAIAQLRKLKCTT